jgi:hypothetical protein
VTYNVIVTPTADAEAMLAGWQGYGRVKDETVT